MAKKRYPVIGGPLDGVHMTSDEFERGYGAPGLEGFHREAGRFADLADQYLAFNCGRNSGRIPGGRVWDPQTSKWVKSPVTSMVWLHVSLFQRPERSLDDIGGSEDEGGEVRERSGAEVRFELVCSCDDETEVERTLCQLGAGGQLARPDGDNLRFVFTLASDDRDAALVEITTALAEIGVTLLGGPTSEPTPDIIWGPAQPQIAP